jgi:spore photoproduct lyase
MAVPGWQQAYGELLDAAASTVEGVDDLDLTVELITHRFTPASRDVLLQWYPRTRLEMDPDQRTEKRSKFGGLKYVYPREVMTGMRRWFDTELARRLPAARVLYWT